MYNQIEKKNSNANQEVVSKNLNDASVSIKNQDCIIENKVRDCKCESKYHKTRRWADGRVRLTKINTKGCEEYHIMLRPDGTYHIHDDGLYRAEVLGRLLYGLEERDGIPFEEREGLSESEAKKLHNIIDEGRREEERLQKGCMLEWDGKVYSFGGYY
jgi:hypothetical protein